jgi:hypothetical protein
MIRMPSVGCSKRRYTMDILIYFLIETIIMTNAINEKCSEADKVLRQLVAHTSVLFGHSVRHILCFHKQLTVCAVHLTMTGAMYIALLLLLIYYDLSIMHTCRMLHKRILVHTPYANLSAHLCTCMEAK